MSQPDFDERQQREVQEFVQRQQQQAMMQQAISKLSDICWDKCVTGTGTSLPRKERDCLSACAQRYLDTSAFVMRHLVKKG